MSFQDQPNFLCVCVCAWKGGGDSIQQMRQVKMVADLEPNQIHEGGQLPLPKFFNYNTTNKWHYFQCSNRGSQIQAVMGKVTVSQRFAQKAKTNFAETFFPMMSFCYRPSYGVKL